MKGTLNRVLLALAGLVLLVIGGSVLAIGLGASAPSWWIHDGKRDVLLSRGDRYRWHDEGWWWWAVIAVLAVVLLLALFWLLSALKRRTLGEMSVDSGDGHSGTLRGRALQKVIEDETEQDPDVAKATVRLRGRRADPRVRAMLRLDGHTSPAQALRRFTEGPLEHARSSAGVRELPAEVRLLTNHPKPERVS